MAFAYPLDKDGDKRKRSKRFVLGEGIAEYDRYKIGIVRYEMAWFYKRLNPKRSDIHKKRIRLIAEIIK